MEAFYNPTRRYCAQAYLIPINYEQQYNAAEDAALSPHRNHSEKRGQVTSHMPIGQAAYVSGG